MAQQVDLQSVPQQRVEQRKEDEYLRTLWFSVFSNALWTAAVR